MEQVSSELLAPWSDREEVSALPEILRPAEGLVAVGSGTVVRSGRLARNRWLVVVTDRRLLCIKGRDPVTRKVIDMPISQIRGVEVRGLIRKTLSLDTGFGTLRIGGLDRAVAASIAWGLTRLMSAFDEEGHLRPAPRAGTPETGPVGALGERVEELTERVAFLEEMVRSNVETGAYDEEP